MESLKMNLQNILASNVRGLQVLAVATATMSVLTLIYGSYSAQMFWLVLLGYFVYGCMGITVTIHRGLTHKSYKTFPWLQKLLSFFGAMGGTGSPIAWVATHINHHKYSDQEQDPHSPSQQGLKMFLLDYDKQDDVKWKMRRLITDSFHINLHRYYFAVVLLWALLLWVIGGWAFMIFAWAMPAFVTIIMSNVTNWIGHMQSFPGNYRTYNLKDKSVNNWLASIPTWGESWHNNHHRFPGNSSFGLKWWEFDITALMIELIRTDRGNAKRQIIKS